MVDRSFVNLDSATRPLHQSAVVKVISDDARPERETNSEGEHFLCHVRSKRLLCLFDYRECLAAVCSMLWLWYSDSNSFS